MDDQDYVEITRMDLLERVYRAVAAWRKGKTDADTTAVITWLIKEELMERK